MELGKLPCWKFWWEFNLQTKEKFTGQKSFESDISLKSFPRKQEDQFSSR
jgi:hypothetical protein